MSKKKQIVKQEHWESVHKCPHCGNTLNLEKIDLKTMATGLVTCPNCDRSAPVNIQIVGEKDLPK